MPPAISVEHLVKRYGAATAVDGVSFEVGEGEFFAFLGPNGAGKTTTINAIVGLANFQQGAIRIFGADVVRDYRQARLQVGLAPQEFNFDRYMSVEEILIYQAGYFGVARAEARVRAAQLLRQFGLWDKRAGDVQKLSGGMKRRLTLARALIHAPRLLILDEPTAGVDVELRLELWRFLRELNRGGMTIFLTTHYLEEAEKLCDRVAIIDSGKLVTLEPTRDLLARLSQDRLEITLATAPAAPPAGLAWLGERLVLDGTRLLVRDATARELPGILRALEGEGLELVDVAIQRRNLESIFLELTGRAP